jgi:hypothetical protein
MNFTIIKTTPFQAKGVAHNHYVVDLNGRSASVSTLTFGVDNLKPDTTNPSLLVVPTGAVVRKKPFIKKVGEDSIVQTGYEIMPAISLEME